MNLLVVEDNEDNIAVLQEEMARVGGVVVTVARSRDSAMAALDAGFFDLMLLDLRIPPSDGSLDTHADHGLSVHSAVQQKAAGTPIVLFSAYGTIDLIPPLLESCGKHDIWGQNEEVPLTAFKQKSDLKKCVALISEYAAQVAALDRIELSSGGRDLALSRQHARILRIFARLNQGANVLLAPLGGGLSTARTLRMEIKNDRGATTCLAVAKLDEIPKVRAERNRYRTSISPILSVGGFTSEIHSLTAGAANIGGIFYQFAREFNASLLDILRADPARAARVVQAMQQLEHDWHQGAFNSLSTIRDIRRSLISDPHLEPFAGQLHARWQELELAEINLRGCCQHRDLHPLNLLVRDDATPLLIDYGDVAPGPACLDAITLEFSLFFHPSCAGLTPGWPSLEQAANWPNVDAYLAAQPIAPYIRACRAWAFAAQGSDRAVYATAYAYAVRQLKYPGTNHALALALANAALARLAAP